MKQIAEKAEMEKSEASGERIKVCHMVVLSHLTGVQRVMFDICRPLDPERYDRYAICQGEGELTRELENHGIRWYAVPSLVRPISPLKDIRALFQIRSICAREKFDIVHTHTSKAGFIGRLAAWMAGVPIILHHVHGFAFHDYSKASARFAFSQLEKIAAYFTDRLIFVNREELEMTVKCRWAPTEKCLTIYNGTDIELFDPEKNGALRDRIRAEYGFSDDLLAILVCGRLDQQKQCLLLPEIAERFDQLNPDASWRIIVAGTGEFDEALKAKIQQLGMSHRFCLVGWYPRPHELMAAADVKLLPSLWEGLPLTLIEAQASGLPIVASNIKGNREVVTEETGFLSDPKDPDSYAKFLDHLYRNPGLREKMSKAARDRAESEFDIRQTFEKVDALYYDLLRASGST